MIIYNSKGQEIKIRRGQFIKNGCFKLENGQFVRIEQDSIVDCIPEYDDMGRVNGYTYFLKEIG